jgi:hypothetical protein
MIESGTEHNRDISVHKVSYGQDKYLVEAQTVTCGGDISVIIGGGTHYHIGAAALAVPRASLADPNIISASASVICVTGHKDDDLARNAALRLAKDLNRIVTVSVGLHVDEASKDDIKILLKNFDAVIDKVINIYKSV